MEKQLIRAICFPAVSVLLASIVVVVGGFLIAERVYRYERISIYPAGSDQPTAYVLNRDEGSIWIFKGEVVHPTRKTPTVMADRGVR